MHNKVMTKDLKKVLEEDTYQSVMVNPRLHDVIGYILDGISFRKCNRIHRRRIETKTKKSSIEQFVTR